MRTFYLPLVLTVGGGILYHLSQKSMPKAANPLWALALAYAVGIGVCVFGALLYTNGKSLPETVRESNWAVWGVGIGAAAIEVGFLLAYRAGWHISLAAVSSSVAVAVLLIPVGLVVFGERLSAWNVVGLALCILGLILVTRR